MHSLYGIHWRILTGYMEIDVHDDVMRGLYVADSERSHGVHGVMIVFGSGGADEIEQDGETRRKVMIANVREALRFEIQRSHDNQNNVSVKCEREKTRRLPMKTVEKFGDGEKTIEAVDRIDGGYVVFCVVIMRIMSYSSQINGKTVRLSTV